MQVTRRTLCKSTLATTIVGVGFAKGAETEPQTEEAEDLIYAFPGLPSEWTAYDAAPDIALTDLTAVQLGSKQPTNPEIALAQKILTESPYGSKNPIEVARYFAQIGQGGRVKGIGEDVRHYVRGWPVRYNPVIVNFFVATGTNPLALSGDYTAWCAAFINWCIARAFSPTKEIVLNDKGLMSPFPATAAKGTKSASSGSFRCWSSDNTDNPRPGDVIVWATAGTVKGCAPGKGHVGFYSGRAPDGRYITLGGNQRDPTNNQSAVVEKRIGKSFSRSDGLVELRSIRAMIAG
jgi:hypothetical protein